MANPKSVSIDPEKLTEFFTQATNLLGNDHISVTAEHGALAGPHAQDFYGDAFSPTTKNRASGAVRPSRVEEVQQILKLANRYNVPLWTVSRGKNLGYGGSNPIVRNSVILDLQRMNQITEINPEHGYAIVEPGVSFFDLYDEIQQRELSLWPSTPAVGWGSVIGNTLDRGFGYTPSGEHSQAQCGMEVVLPNGEVLRTGSGAMSGNRAWSLYKGGFGPSVDGLFFQSNLGVVTKLGIHITPAPEAYASLEVVARNEKDLAPLVSILSDLQRRSVILTSVSVANIFRLALTDKNPEVQAKIAPYMKPDSCVPYSVLENIHREYDIGFWKAYFSLYGSVEMLPALLETVRRVLYDTIPDARIEAKEVPGEKGKHLRASDMKHDIIPLSGVPTLSPLSIINTRQEPGGHIDVSPVIPPSGAELFDWYLVAKQRIQDANFDYFVDFYIFPRHVIAIQLVIYALSEEERVRELCDRLLRDAAERGYMEYRAHVDYMDRVAGTRDFNGGIFGRFVSRLKGLLDPNAILGGGKSGIWSEGPSSG
ncbi:hypothetical protein PHISCL_04537 [Aspergillus sclerotialis]|uniref:FAD-binding PCMH-type domain-containing protein n=1 Tax=Aspergillus sclerotialis TaxID=2070753 RepID=A0A3A2ZJB7_9EURO|nr:hypothetical protein PHISCL_04537 [Aspergillus sclerotialis]